jgi:hypothetical protein
MAPPEGMLGWVAPWDITFLADYRQTGLTEESADLSDSDFCQNKLDAKGFKFGSRLQPLE